VGLNPQVPVPTSTIIDSVLGLITGMAVATVIGRVIWPLLPQRLLRDDLLEFFGQLKTFSNRQLKIQGSPAIANNSLERPGPVTVGERQRDGYEDRPRERPSREREVEVVPIDQSGALTVPVILEAW